jgi:hypothetical protein
VNLSDLPAQLDWIDRIEGIVSTFINADWAGARRRAGALGVVNEFIDCLTFANAPTVFVSRDCSWSGLEIERLLRRHGVKVWNRGIMGNELYFCIKRRQARWAEYLLLRAGVPITSALVDPRNRNYTEGYAPRSEPPVLNRRR